MDKLLPTSNPFLNDQTKEVKEKLPTVSSLSAFLASLNQSSSNSRLKRFLDETGSLDVNISDTNSCRLSDISSVSNACFNHTDDYDEEENDNESIGCETNASFDNIIDSASSYRSEDGSIGDLENEEKDDNSHEVYDYVDIIDRVNNNYISEKGTTDKYESPGKADNKKIPFEEEIKNFMSYDTNDEDSPKKNHHKETPNDNEVKRDNVDVENGYEEIKEVQASSLLRHFKVTEDSRECEDHEGAELQGQNSLSKRKSPISDVEHNGNSTGKNSPFRSLEGSKDALLENKFVANNLRDLKMNNEILQSSKKLSNSRASTQNPSKASKVTLEFFCSKVAEGGGDGGLRLKDTFRLHKLQHEQMDDINTISELFRSHASSELKHSHHSSHTNNSHNDTSHNNSSHHSNSSVIKDTNGSKAVDQSDNSATSSVEHPCNNFQNLKEPPSTPPTLLSRAAPMASRRTSKAQHKDRVFPGTARRVDDKHTTHAALSSGGVSEVCGEDSQRPRVSQAKATTGNIADKLNEIADKVVKEDTGMLDSHKVDKVAKKSCLSADVSRDALRADVKEEDELEGCKEFGMKKSKTLDFGNEDIERDLQEIRSLLYGAKSSQEVCNKEREEEEEEGRGVCLERIKLEERSKGEKVLNAKTLHTNPFYEVQGGEKGGGKEVEKETKGKLADSTEERQDGDKRLKNGAVVGGGRVARGRRGRVRRLNEVKTENNEINKEQKALKETKNPKETKKLLVKKVPGALKKVVNRQANGEEKGARNEARVEEKQDEKAPVGKGRKEKVEEEEEVCKEHEVWKGGEVRERSSEGKKCLNGSSMKRLKQRKDFERNESVDNSKQHVTTNEEESVCAAKAGNSMRAVQKVASEEEQEGEERGEAVMKEDLVVEEKAVVREDKVAKEDMVAREDMVVREDMVASEKGEEDVPSAGAAMSVIDELLEELRRSHVEEGFSVESVTEASGRWDGEGGVDTAGEKARNDGRGCEDDLYRGGGEEKVDGGVGEDDGGMREVDGGMKEDDGEVREDDGGAMNISSRLHDYSQSISEYLDHHMQAQGFQMQEEPAQEAPEGGVRSKSSKNPFIDSDDSDVDAGDFKRDLLEQLVPTPDHNDSCNGALDVGVFDDLSHYVPPYDGAAYEEDSKKDLREDLKEDLREAPRRTFTLSPELTDCESVTSIVSRNASKCGDGDDARRNGDDGGLVDRQEKEDSGDDDDDDGDDGDDDAVTSPSSLPHVVDGLSSGDEVEEDISRKKESADDDDAYRLNKRSSVKAREEEEEDEEESVERPLKDDDEATTKTQAASSSNHSTNASKPPQCTARKVLRHEDRPLPSMAYYKEPPKPANNKNKPSDHKNNSKKESLEGSKNSDVTKRQEASEGGAELRTTSKCNANGRVFSRMDERVSNRGRPTGRRRERRSIESRDKPLDASQQEAFKNDQNEPNKAPPPPTEGGDRPPGVQDPIEKRKMSEITLFQSSMRHSRHNNNSINNSNNNSINNSNNNSINSISSSPTTKANGTRHKHLSCESVHSCNNTDVSKPSKKGADEAKESPYSCNGDDDASVKERGGRGSEDEGRRNELKNGENDLTGKYNDVGLDTKQAPTEESENKQSVEALHADVTQEASKPATSEQKAKVARGSDKESFLIEGVLFRAQYLGSTQLVSEGQPSKATRLMQAQEAINRIKDPALKGNPRPGTLVDLFVSVEKIMVLNTDLQEIMMDHALRTISYIADIGDVLVIMARRGPISSDNNNNLTEPSNDSSNGLSNSSNGKIELDGKASSHLSANHSQAKICCHVFESDEAQLIAQSISQAFQVAYVEFLKANGINDPDLIKVDYQDVLSQQEVFGEELFLFSNRDMQKEVLVPKGKGEALGMVIVESGWGSMVPTVVLANMAPGGAAARGGQLNIGDQIISVNGISLVGLPLSTCQAHLKALKGEVLARFMVVSCTPVVEVLVKRPDIKYQLGFSVQNGVICSLLRGGIAERGGVRVGHRIIEINGQSVVAVPHDKIVSTLASSVGEIHMKTMQTSIYRLLTGQDTPHYI